MKQFLVGEAIETGMAKARILRSSIIVAKAQVDSAPTSADRILDWMRGIKAARDVIAQCAAVPGIDPVAKEEYNDPALVLSVELNSIVTACDSCLAWIAANFPQDGSGFLLKDKIVNGALEPRVFSVAALSGFSATLGTLLAAFS
jgi:hypothetical protein